ncbi:catalase [Leptospira langatensis]|uniref:Catalase n=1 Tax=Leptospira langatensis TaxID=2484983 RepID=A0A5F1ZX38_9LEPT|nr:catalase [Leptospira langatensis]TGJ98441.1 catalase [Leptospira langatensis]TGL43356.1 catalase [Leptospira langatensis]
MKPISKNWKEDIAANEEERYAGYVKKFQAIQKVNSAKFGKGRTLHRKQLLGIKAQLEVLSDLPEHAKQGLFSKPGRYETWIRLSSGSMKLQSDRIGDIRGFALKVSGVSGPSALRNGNTSFQDFLLINLEAFSSPKSDEFVGIVVAAANGGGALLKYLFKTYGFFGALAKIKKAGASFNKPFSGFATEKFFSAAPISFGAYAGRLRLLPPKEEKIEKNASKDWGEDMKSRLQKGSLTYELQAQFFADEKTTPIEDASVNWPESEAPYLTIAKLILPKQDLNSADGESFQKKVEETIFDPWEALLEHKPLGDVMRARKHVYFASQKGRGAV